MTAQEKLQQIKNLVKQGLGVSTEKEAKSETEKKAAFSENQTEKPNLETEDPLNNLTLAFQKQSLELKAVAENYENQQKQLIQLMELMGKWLAEPKTQPLALHKSPFHETKNQRQERLEALCEQIKTLKA